jgi:acyl-CoA dehydrogenase
VAAATDKPALDERALNALRLDVRAFLDERRANGAFEPRCDGWQSGFSRAFSQDLARQGWVAMTMPSRYGGAGRSALERLVVAEELLAAGAPVAAHWIAERQVAPMVLRVGTDQQRERFLPPITRGELVFALGLSEPNSGSDLASVRTRAKPSDDGWLLSGQKIWTSMAYEADFIIVLCRTSDGEDRHDGLSQMVVDLAWPGVEVRRIPTMTGDDHFCEVFFDEVAVPHENLIGTEGAGWSQVTAELAFERGGPERFLSTFPLFDAFVTEVARDDDPAMLTSIGGLVAELIALRALGTEVALAIDHGRQFGTEAALQKDAGTKFEQRLIETLRGLGASSATAPERVRELFFEASLGAPSFTLRGGTTEVLRGIVGRDLTR